jgi:hypothetical protein
MTTEERYDRSSPTARADADDLGLAVTVQEVQDHYGLLE